MADTLRHYLIVVGERDAMLGWHHAANRLFPTIGLASKGVGIKHSPLATAWWWTAALPINDADTEEALEALRQTLYSAVDICGKWIVWGEQPFRVVDQVVFHSHHPLIDVAHKLLFFRGQEPGGEPDEVLPWFCRWPHVNAVETAVVSKKRRKTPTEGPHE